MYPHFEEYNFEDHRNTIDYSTPLEHEQVVLHCVELELLKKERQVLSLNSFHWKYDLLRSLNRRSMQSSFRIIIKPFSWEIARLLRIRITLLITFSIERN